MTTNRRLVVIGGIVCAVLLGAHVILNIAFRSHSDAIADGFNVVWTLLAVAVCVRLAVTSPTGLRRNWGLLASGIALWLIATVIAAYAQFLQHADFRLAQWDDLVYFSYGVPILLAITTSEDAGLGQIFFCLDAVLVLFFGLLAYTSLFAALPFSSGPQHPVSLARVVEIYDLENIVLAILAPVRIFISRRGSAERRFFIALSAYLWIYAIAARVYNHMVVAQSEPGLVNVLLDIPFAVLTFSAALEWPPAAATGDTKSQRRVAVLIDNARPLLLGLALVALSGMTARTHLNLAMTIIFGVFVIYGLRSAMLQSRFSQTQEALEDAHDRLEQLVLQDGLTGIANRRCFDQRFVQEFARARRTGSPLSVLLIDIDHFKRLNDTYGHLAGDECLVRVARLLQRTLNRPGDLLARYGGEEFIALLPETDETGALKVAARLHDALSRTEPITAIQGQVTVSIGGTTWERRRGLPPGTVISTADRALYLAKQNGRNRTEYLPLVAQP